MAVSAEMHSAMAMKSGQFDALIFAPTPEKTMEERLRLTRRKLQPYPFVW
jgi:hypothetical protein